MLLLLPQDSRFVISGGSLKLLQHIGLFSGLPLEDPHNYSRNVFFVRKSMMGHQNLFIDAIDLLVFPLSLIGEAIIWVI